MWVLAFEDKQPGDAKYMLGCEKPSQGYPTKLVKVAGEGDAPWSTQMTHWGRGLKHFLFSPRNPGKMIQFDEHIFQTGWFNHQLAQALVFHTYGEATLPETNSKFLQ